MGFTPQQLWAMELWEFNAAVKGYKKAHGIKDPVRAPTVAEFERAVATSRI